MHLRRFEDVAMDKGIVKETDINAAKRVQEQTQQSISDILTRHNIITNEEVLMVYELMRYNRVEIEKEEINKDLFETYAVELGILIENYVIPFKRVDGVLHIATSNPMNYPVFDKLQKIYEVNRTEIYIENKDIIDFKIKEMFPTYTGEELESIITEIDEEEIDDESLLEDVNVSDSPLVRRVDYIISEAIRVGASDIHIEPQDRKDTKVRFRVDGDLIEFTTIPRRWRNHAVARIKIISKMDISKKREPQDGEFGFTFRGRVFNMRVSTIPTIHGEKVVLRILGSQGDILELGELNFLENYEKVKEKISKHQGIIVVTGPTGSGKTTTLASIISERNKPDVNILTIENPAEIRMEGVNQVEVTRNMGFAKILRAFLRQDPDIIMVGEVRDKESADIAIQASLTGHLLLTTMHTNSAVGVVTRLVDMGVEPYLVADALELVISQRLVKRLCKHCKEEDKEGLESAKKQYPEIFKEVKKVYKSKGCTECNNLGFIGRLPVFEVLALDDELRRLVAKSDVEGLKISGAVKPIIYDGLEKVKLGLTSFKEVYENLYFA